jgi:hypothetical protein
MAKGPLVTDAVEVLIAAVYQKHPKWKAPVVRNEVDFHLHKDNPKLPPGWPSLSTVQKVLAKVRKPRSPDPQEKPWSIATLGDYPIPPEALPKVLELWKYTLELPPLSPEVVSTLQRLTKPIIEEHHLPETLLEEISEKAERRELTIREAKWAARLSYVKPPNDGILGIPFVRGQKIPFPSVAWLHLIALMYADAEMTMELIGRHFTSKALDRFIVGLPI